MPRVTATGPPGRRLPIGAVALAVSATLTVGACSDPAPSPEKVRRERVEARLRQSFTTPQSACILRRADEAVLVALDRDTDLADDTPEAKAYSDAVIDCVSDPDSSSGTETTEPDRSTSTPDGDPGTTSTNGTAGTTGTTGP